VKVDKLWKRIKELPDKEAFELGKPIIDSKSTLINTINALEKQNCVMYIPEDQVIVLI
jgi:hypothetical protein